MENNNFNTNRPQLKKIKRPIRRIEPLSSTQPLNNIIQETAPKVEKKAEVSGISNSAEIDRFLDSPTPLAKVSNNGANYQDSIQYIDEEAYNEEVYGVSPNSATPPEWLNVKTLAVMVVCALFIGVFAGKIFFSGSKVVRNGLQGVVVNAEVPRGRARCGVAERTQGCVLYIMNPQRQDLSAKDFYDLASQMTGRQRFMIETGNMRYANTKIKPGNIAQLNIPPL